MKWVDKEKGLTYLSSASQQVQQEIDKEVLDSAAKIVENFENQILRIKLYVIKWRILKIIRYFCSVIPVYVGKGHGIHPKLVYYGLDFFFSIDM